MLRAKKGNEWFRKISNCRDSVLELVLLALIVDIRNNQISYENCCRLQLFSRNTVVF